MIQNHLYSAGRNVTLRVQGSPKPHHPPPSLSLSLSLKNGALQFITTQHCVRSLRCVCCPCHYNT